jgi:hypothetical protein
LQVGQLLDQVSDVLVRHLFGIRPYDPRAGEITEPSSL